jgi:benzodiazapine receptor
MIARYGWLAVFLLLVVGAAALSSSFEAGEWYFLLKKPAWTPPPWVFSPIWSLLYVLMALAMWLAWMSGHYVRSGAFAWWLLQLVLNVAWSWLFFGLTRSGWAMAEMLLLIGCVVLCMRALAACSRLSAALMVPYLLWLVFAWVLNFIIWLQNGGGFGISLA